MTAGATGAECRRLGVTVPAALVLGRPPAQVAMVTGVAQADMTGQQAVGSAPLTVLVVTNFFCCATHSGPIFQTVSFAELCGIGSVRRRQCRSIRSGGLRACLATWALA